MIKNTQPQYGILLHISSLPSQSYIGDLGAEAFRFIDFLAEVGASVWQTLPINMPHADNSPYQCLSAHACNPDFISLDALQQQGWLRKADLALALNSKAALLAQAFDAFDAQAQAPDKKAFKAFCKAQAYWLDDFALFLTLRKQFNQAGWNQWPDAYKNRDARTLKQARKTLAHDIVVTQFTQYIFFSQWLKLKQYAASKQVALFGDVPIFVAYDSADVWANPQLFKLDADKNQTVVAGVPPDYFSATGQRWGNPHYNWDAMAQDGYAWWVARMRTQHALFDIVRIDHFRGLEAAWEIPASEETAINGQWVLAPGDALLTAIQAALPNMALVAEDLGIITPEVDALRLKFNLPGMKILQFAFSGTEDNPYLPQNIEPNSVAYTGTHDNDTTLGWYNALDEQTHTHFNDYLRAFYAYDHTPNLPVDLMDIVLATPSKLAIIPMQDVLHLDGAHRMNTPGTIENNWRWRFTWVQLSPQLKQQLKEGAKQHGRYATA